MANHETEEPEQQAISFLAAANKAHGTSYSLVRRLPGGYQTGAFELVGMDGRRAVLKWWPWTRPADQMRQAAATVEAARAAGWPTPAWLHWGIGTDGRPYEIQEFVAGRHLSDLDADSLQLLLKVNERQADLDPPTQHDWSPWVQDMVYNGRDDVVGRMGRASS